MKEVLYEVRCLKSTEDMILALAGQFKLDNLSNCPASARIISSVDFKHRTSYNTSFMLLYCSSLPPSSFTEPELGSLTAICVVFVFIKNWSSRRILSSIGRITYWNSKAL